ncbi:MAG: hypothetical protein LBP79_06965 [Clostridiales bacterium]|jgi:hypothetical protein|nr:hypothetical protein [Clostridiales bacterium]
MTYKSDSSYAEFAEKYGEQAKERMFYYIKIGEKILTIKRRGDRTLALRGKIIETQPLRVAFIDTFAIRFGALYAALMFFVLLGGYMDVFAVVSLSVAVYTALFLASKTRGAETARMLANDFKLTPSLEKEKYYIPYNYFYFYLAIIFFLVYPVYFMLNAGFNVDGFISIVVTSAAALAAVVWLTFTRNFTEIFIADREGIIRQNIFLAKDKLFYSAESIESVTVRNKNIRGEDKEGAFCFEIVLKDGALYRPASKFPHIKEKKTIYLPFNKINAEIIKEKLGIDADAFNYDEYYK